VERCLATGRENHVELSGIVDFPEGFDFKKLVASPEVAAMWNQRSRTIPILFNQWWRQNRDEAFDTLLARGRELKSLPGEYFYIFTSSSLTPEDAAWFVGKMTALEPEERHALLTENGMLSGSYPDALDLLIAAAHDPEDLRTLHEIGAGAMAFTGVERALPHLETLGDPAARVAFLESLPEPSKDRPPTMGTAEKEKSLVLLRAKLSEWHATPEQIEKIARTLHFTP
jgi:hypothetical protein